MTLNSGTRLGPYEILSPLGAGGMGEVYKAKDTRLQREVAVKVLPSHLSENAELRQRFEREARAISALSHPHICTLHDVGNQDGVEYLVMECLEGESLADRLTKGALPPDQVLRYGIQVADALEAAHRHGIVHRDLKPGNIMLTKSGVKLLDFGLAKHRASATQSEIAQLSSLPTEASPSRPLTEQGSILGTFQYMAPEQLEGREADARTDIFAFGCVLYEMATGRKAFTGKSRASMIGAILKDQPAPISSISPMTPPALDRLVQTCLAKDPDDRFQTAHDVRLQLQWIAEGGSQAGAPAVVVARRRSREKTAWLIAGVAAIAAAAGWYRVLSQPKETRHPIRLSLPKPADAPFALAESLTPSPDGSRIAFVGHTNDGRQTLWVRPIGSLQPRELAGTDGARFPFWSPDGRSIAFFADGRLKKIEASGGPSETLAEAPSPWGGSWGTKGTIVFVPHDYDGVFRVAVAGGAPERITALAPGEEAHRWPVLLPDGDHFLFLVDANQTEGHWLALSSLSSGKITHLAHAISNLAFAAPNRVLYVKGGSLVAQKLDPRNLRLEGDPEPVGESVLPLGDNHRFDFGASGSGLLLYQTMDPDLQFVWLDRAGRRLESVGAPGRYGRFEISPDGSRAAFEKLDSDGRNENLWSLDLARGIASRVTSGKAADFGPVWTPDGRTLVFASLRGNVNGNLYATPASGGGADRMLLEVQPTGATAWTVSPDGRTVVYDTRKAETLADLWMLPLGGREPRPLRATRFAETQAQFSPDGKWLAFVANDSGRDEVYVRSVADPSLQVQVSTSGGERPRWRGDGKEIYFASGPVLMAAALTPGADIRAAPPRSLFALHGLAGDYDVSKSGDRFLVTTSPHESAEPIAVAVLDWAEGLQKQ